MTNNGFGTVVLNRVAPAALNGAGQVRYGANEINWSLDAPMPFVEASRFGVSAA
jgi:hypothetical protein